MADGTLTKRLVDFLCKGDFESEVDNFLQGLPLRSSQPREPRLMSRPDP